MMKRQDYIYQFQDEAFQSYQKNNLLLDVAGNVFEQVYADVDFKIRQPDLLGKTVKATPLQFSSIFYMVEDLSDLAGIESPAIYVYEDFYYGAESYGVDQYWIEISAKTIRELKENEIRFILAREIYKIMDGVTKTNTIMKEQLKVVPDKMKKIIQLSYNKWYRMANYSADNFGYLACKNIKDAVYSIIKLVLNSIPLSEEVNIHEFILQASEISGLNDNIYNYTKLDESIPYAPYRIKNLMSFAISDRCMKYFR